MTHSLRVYTGGTFDLFHEGHVRLLRQCARLAGTGEVVVSLNSDEFISRYKGKPPVVPYAHRREVLESCRWVSRVVTNTGGADSRPAIESVAPQVVAIGVDWAPPKDYHAQMGFTQEWLDERGIVLVYLHREPAGSSTTQIKRSVLAGATALVSA